MGFAVCVHLSTWDALTAVMSQHAYPVMLTTFFSVINATIPLPQVTIMTIGLQNRAKETVPPVLT
jgi:hypothetical protein